MHIFTEAGGWNMFGEGTKRTNSDENKYEIYFIPEPGDGPQTHSCVQKHTRTHCSLYLLYRV